MTCRLLLPRLPARLTPSPSISSPFARCCYASTSSIPTPEQFQSFHPDYASKRPAPSTTDELRADASQTKQAEITLRRFWKQVVLLQDEESGSWSVLLDRRVLKTPSLQPLSLPREKRTAAMVIAHEWDRQSKLLKPHSLPMTSLASRAIDGLSDPVTKAQVIQVLNRYLHTDTVCFLESGKSQALSRLQEQHWTPLIKWVEDTYNVKIQVAEGQLFNRQSEETVRALAAVVEKYDAFKLAGFERAVMASKSYLIALGIAEGFLTADQAAQAAHVEVQSQIDRWGEVEDTHDVDHQDIRVRLGSAALIVGPLDIKH